MNDGNGVLRTQQAMRKGQRVGPVLALLGAVALMALVPGCSLLSAPQKVITAVVPGSQSTAPDPLYLQIQLQRFTDEFCAHMAPAIERYVQQVGTDPARIDGLKWKLAAFFAAVSIASGPNPKANLLDLVALTTLTRMTVQDRMASSTNASAIQAWLDTVRLLETNVWTLAATALEPAHLAELREAIRGWYARNPEVRTAFFARPQEFASMIKTSQPKESELTSVFSLVNLDPTAGLDPAVREVTLTRLFAERAMFTAQRMSFVLRLQAELLAEEIAQQPQLQSVLTTAARFSVSADRISRAAESVSLAATQLPDRISAERKEILAALDQQEGKLRELAAAVHRSLVAGEAMSTSLNTTLTTFDALMKRFGVGEPKTNSVPETNAHPFNVLDYGTVAGQIGVMAKDLNTLIASVNQSVPQLAQVSEQAGANAERVVNRAFRLGLVLILVLLAGAVLAGLTYRVLANRLSRRSSAPSAPASAA